MTISAQTNRVLVVNSLTEAVAVGFRKARLREEVLAAFTEFAGKPQALRLPSAPAHPQC